MYHDFKIPELSRRQCFDPLAGGAALVTPTRALARRMTAAYAEHRLEKGEEVWETPDILPFGSWLSRMIHEPLYSTGALPSSREFGVCLMDDLQEALVWERIISESDAADRLLGVYETARMAREAWRLCRQWNVEIGDGMQWLAPDPAAFAGWAEAFKRFCRNHGYMDRAGLALFLAKKVRKGLGRLPSDLIPAGFDEYSPAQMELFSALYDRGTGVYGLAGPKRAASASRATFADDASEIRAAAMWARRRIENDPEAKIGVVSPRLAADREDVRRVFSEVFHPSSVFSGQDPGNPMFQISAAPLLSEYPVVSAARAILELAGRQGSEVFEWSRILRSPFISGAEAEYASRAALDAQIRAAGDLYFSVSRVAATARAMGASFDKNSDLQILVGVLESLQSRAEGLPARQRADQWAKEFSAILEDAGWPGQRSLSESEYQTVSAWKDAIEEFSGIGFLTGPISRAEALGIFFRKLSDTFFQPEQPDTGVRITGVLESAGEEFDALWIMGLHHENWPPQARPNPFLPVAVQRSLGLPHCSPARELSYAGLITQRLLESADEVICSFGRTDGESIRLASPLIDHLDEYAPGKFPASEQKSYWERIYCRGYTEDIQDVHGAPAAEGSEIGGGTGIMKSQAMCPFQAYGRYRLGARGLESPEPGLKPGQRGTLVHDVLELLWKQLGGNRALEEMSREQMGRCIQDAVDAAVSKMAGKMPETFTDRFTGVETGRLQRLMEEWIGAEYERAPFSVAETESRMHVRIGGIGLSAFADRIDRLDNGRLVIIDYKTGEISAKDWFADRITEPQLPLYSLAASKDLLAGVFFGRVKKGKTGYTGIAETEGIVPGCMGIMDDGGIAKGFESMQEVLSFWETKLAALAEEIRAGYAAVLPVSQNKSCRYCDLSPLCRIWDASQKPAVDEKADNDTGQ
ncbi:MAG: PD-(D/E)XK nuclease family protein [Desulfobacteraceae bacterium]|nr:PD-(D/E)XK nuclease family protein [Desulfobacteraceae bacterium]